MANKEQWYNTNPEIFKKEKEKILSTIENIQIKFDENENLYFEIDFNHDLFQTIKFRFIYSYNFPNEYRPIKAYLIEPSYELLRDTLKEKSGIDIEANIIFTLFEFDEYGCYIWPFNRIRVDPPAPIHKYITFYHDQISSWIERINKKDEISDSESYDRDASLQKLREALLRGDDEICKFDSTDPKVIRQQLRDALLRGNQLAKDMKSSHKTT